MTVLEIRAERKDVATREKDVEMMHAVMMSMNDENAYYDWICYGLPDEPTPEDFHDAAVNVFTYLEHVKTFEWIFEHYKKHGIYKPDGETVEWMMENELTPFEIVG